uniref:KRAB domain-containing protein n=1 Tax=Salvator merianae TaxID=96440 RepID=A0A8D0CCM3_SALMN
MFSQSLSWWVANISTVNAGLPFPGCSSPFTADGRHSARSLQVNFEDVAVFFTRGQWALLDAEQKALYSDVMEENFTNVTFLGSSVPKPDLISWLEQGEEPWIPASCDLDGEKVMASRAGEDPADDTLLGTQMSVQSPRVRGPIRTFH